MNSSHFCEFDVNRYKYPDIHMSNGLYTSFILRMTFCAVCYVLIKVTQCRKTPTLPLKVKVKFTTNVHAVQIMLITSRLATHSALINNECCNTYRTNVDVFALSRI